MSKQGFIKRLLGVASLALGHRYEQAKKELALGRAHRKAHEDSNRKPAFETNHLGKKRRWISKGKDRNTTDGNRMSQQTMRRRDRWPA